MKAAATTYYESCEYRYAEEFADLAIKAYGEKIPADVLFQASKIKKALRKYAEAEKLIDQIVALSAAGHTIPGQMLHEMAVAKKEYGKLEEAEKLIIKALEVKEPVSPQVAYDAALIKYALKQYIIAEQNMIYAEKTFGKIIPVNFHYQYALIKKELNKLVEAEELFNKAMKGYEANSNVELLKDAADVKHKLKKYEEAELFYDKAMTLALPKNQKLPAQSLWNAAFTKYHLKKYQESEQLINQAEAAFGTQVSAGFYYDAGLIKKSCNHPDAAIYYEKALNAYTSAKLQIPADLYYQNAESKYNSKKVKEAEPYIDQALTDYGNKVPVPVLFLAGKIKFTLQKFTEADQLLAKAMEESGEKVSTDILVVASAIKNQLKDWPAAELLNEKIIAEYVQAKKTLPLKLFHNTLIIKFESKKFQEGESLYGQIVAAYGTNVPYNTMYWGAKIKLALMKYEEAEAILEKAMTPANKNNILLSETMLEVKLKLKKFHEAEALIEKIFSIPEHKVSRNTLYFASETKYNLKKFDEAEKFLDQVIADQSIPVKVELLHSAAMVKKELGKLEEAKSFHEKAMIAYGDKAPAYFAALFVKENPSDTTY